MHYSYEVTVKTSNNGADPAILPIKLASGKITRFQLVFMSGCDRLIRARLYAGAEQLLPTNMDGFYSLDGDTVDVRLWYDIDADRNDLYLVAWNVGAKLNHKLTVMLDVQASDEPDIPSSLKYLADAVNNLVTMLRSWF